MPDAQHTPGPWEAIGPDPFGDYTIAPESEVLAVGASMCGGPGTSLAVSNMRPPEEVAANASLIAAAPDLLRALTLAHTTIHLAINAGALKPRKTPALIEIQSEISKVLAKARGEG